MKKIFLTMIVAIAVALCFSGCDARLPHNDEDSNVSQSSEEKTSRKPVSPITDGGGFDWS